MSKNFPMLARRVYHVEPPARRRSPDRPMSVLALGLSRTGTNSLRTALLQLGYSDCYHGFSLISGDGWHDGVAWHALLKRKYSSAASCTTPLAISAAQFDEILGNCMAISDIPAVLFAEELLAAYPDAKVILNRRSNIQEWKASFRTTTLAAERSPLMWLCSFADAELFWMERVFILCIRALFGHSSNFETNAEHVYAAHYARLEEKLSAMQKKYLDWEVQDRWGPLCEFLGKPIPKTEFPRENQRNAHDENIERLMGRKVVTAMVRLAVAVTALLALIFALWWNVAR